MDSVIIVSEVVAWYRQWKWNLNMWVTRVKKRALPHSLIEWGWGGGQMATDFIPVVSGVTLGALLAEWYREGRVRCLLPPLLPSWNSLLKLPGETQLLLVQISYLQVTEDKKPSQNVWHKCLSVLIFVFPQNRKHKCRQTCLAQLIKVPPGT